MAQLPPKVPSMTPNWPAFPHQRMSHIAHHPSWVDEFLDFSSSRRGSHRRSVSDSITFLEPTSSNITAMMMHGNDKHDNNNDSNDFDRLDDEQLMSMFSDDMTAVMVPSNPSTPSDQHSNNDEKSNVLDQQHQNQYHHHVPKHEPGEVESSCMSDLQLPPPSTTTTGDTFMDPKRVKRILANRQSAQRSRVRKLQYISELERSVTSLQSEVSALSPRVAFLDHQRLILNVDNSTLKQRIAALAQDKIFKDAHQEALQKEIERLRQVYHQQSLKNTTNAPEREAAHQTPNSDNIDCADDDAEEVHYTYCEDQRESVDL